MDIISLHIHQGFVVFILDSIVNIISFISRKNKRVNPNNNVVNDVNIEKQNSSHLDNIKSTELKIELEKVREAKRNELILNDKRIPFACVVNQLMMKNQQMHPQRLNYIFVK